MQRIFDEIRMCLDNECYVAALALALTLPDVCGKAEFPRIRKNRDRYIKWYKRNVGDFREWLFEVTDDNRQSPHLDAEMVYDLRCALLHSGNIETKKEEIKDIYLIVNDELIKEAFAGSANENGEITNVSYSFDPKALCNILLKAAERYYSRTKADMSYAHIRIIDKKATR